MKIVGDFTLLAKDIVSKAHFWMSIPFGDVDRIKRRAAGAVASPVGGGQPVRICS
jgi:hypothetical protein